MKQVRAMTTDQRHKEQNKKLTQKQWLVYYYLLSICNWNSIDKEDHYFLYKNKLNISQASKIIKISRPTFYTALEKLKEDLIVKEHKDYYTIEIPKIYASIDQKTLSFLLPFQKVLGVDLIRTYVLLSRIYQHDELDKHFTKIMLIDILGHNKNDTSYYELMELILGFLTFEGLIKINIKTITTELGFHKDYLLTGIYPIKEQQPIVDNDLALDKELTEKIKEMLKKEGFWDFEE